jgi:hypothetical protein
MAMNMAMDTAMDIDISLCQFCGTHLRVSNPITIEFTFDLNDANRMPLLDYSYPLSYKQYTTEGNAPIDDGEPYIIHFCSKQCFMHFHGHVNQFQDNENLISNKRQKK